MLIVCVRGAGEPVTGNMCSGVVRGFDNVVELVYRPEIRPIGMLSYAESVAGCRAALRRIDEQGEDYIIVCFSLGAAAAGDFVMLDRPKHCKGIILLADPLRDRKQCSNKGVPANHYGVGGERLITGIPVFSFAIPDDPITSCPADNGLRVVSSAVTGRNQPLAARCYWDAVYTFTWLWKYAAAGRHVAYGAERMPGDGRTYVQAAADALRALVKS
jgi:hypothetical protein